MRLSEELFSKKRDLPPAKGSLFNGAVGYDQDAVEDYLEEIAVKVEKMEKEISNLHAQLERANEDQNIPAAINIEPEDTESLGMKEDIKKKLKQIETLERSYKRMIYLAEQESVEIKTEAEEEAMKVLKTAQEKAENLIREAHTRYMEKEREITTLNSTTEKVKEELKNIAKSIENAVS